MSPCHMTRKSWMNARLIKSMIGCNRVLQTI